MTRRSLMLLYRVCLFSACAAVAGCALTAPPRVVAPTWMRALGIDASNYQYPPYTSGVINWNRVAADGIGFAVTKSSEGCVGYIHYTDPTLAENMAGATHAGVLIGPYHFAHPIHDPGAGGAMAEARYFVAYAGAYMTAGYIRPGLDIEVEGGSSVSAWINHFLNDVYDMTGTVPIIYTYSNYASNYLNSTVAHRNLWMADYPAPRNTQKPLTGAPQTGSPPISPFNSWNFWQYTDAAKVCGISPNNRSGKIAVDGDVANGNLAYIQSFLIPAQVQVPGGKQMLNGQSLPVQTIATQDATAVTWTGGGVNGNWSNSSNWSSAWAAGDVSKFTDSSVNTDHVNFNEVIRGNKVVNVGQIYVTDSKSPAVTINGTDTLQFQTYLDPIYSNSKNMLTINAPMEFYGTMGGVNANAGTNSMYAGPGNIVLGGSITINDSQSQVIRDGFNNVIATWDGSVNPVPGNVIITGAIFDAVGTPTAYINGFLFANAGGYDDIVSNNASWKGGIYIQGGAIMIVSAGGSTGTGPVTLNGTRNAISNPENSPNHTGIAGEGTVNGPVTLAGASSSFITGGGKLINNYSGYIPTTGRLTLAAGLNMLNIKNDHLVSQTMTFNFYLSGAAHSSIAIGDTFTIGSGDVVALHGTPKVGTYHLFEYSTLVNAGNLSSWSLSGPAGFSYSLINNIGNKSIDLIINAVTH